MAKAAMDKINKEPRELNYINPLNWAHEREYRLAIPLRKNEEPWNTDPYHPEEIAELYLGLEMEEGNVGRVISMAIATNPKITIYKVKRTPDGIFGFDQRSNSA